MYILRKFIDFKNEMMCDFVGFYIEVTVNSNDMISEIEDRLVGEGEGIFVLDRVFDNILDVFVSDFELIKRIE